MIALRGRRFSDIRMTQTGSQNTEFQNCNLRNILKDGATAGFAVWSLKESAWKGKTLVRREMLLLRSTFSPGTLWSLCTFCFRAFTFTQLTCHWTLRFFFDRASQYNLSNWPTYCTNSYFIMSLLYTSTCFEQNCAHHQEIKIVSHSIWHHHTESAVWYNFDLLMMSKVLLETCRGV